MQSIQEATLYFFGPVTIAYLAAAALLFLLYKLTPSPWTSTIERPDRPGLEMLFGLLAAVALLLIGNFMRIDKLWKPDTQPWSGIWWIITNIEIYAPIFIVLAWRKHSLNTVYLSYRGVWVKVLVGLVVGLLCSWLFLALRNEPGRFAEVVTSSVQWRSLQNFPAVFLEGVALAFLFVRLQWTLGTRWALLIPSILFALSHVPGSVQQGESLVTISSFFFLNTALCTVLLRVCQQTRDVIFLGMVHYIMDVTIRAFG
jgi:hypothetical protein